MAVPDFQSIMLPLLKFLKDKQEHTNKEIIEHISNHFNLSQADRDERLPSSSSVYLISKVGWAETHMKMAGLIESPRRAIYKITNDGIEALHKNISQINLSYLKNFKKYQEKRDKTKFNFEGDGIYAFKPKPHRFLCFFVKGKKLIITNGLIKKSDKLPKNEKEKALKRREDYETKCKKNQYYEYHLQ